MDVTICNNTKENFSWKPEKTIVEFHKMTSILNNKNFTIYLLTIAVKLDNYFLGILWEYSLVLLQVVNYIYSPWKM